MKTSTPLLALAAIARLTNAHANVWAVWVNGKDQGLSNKPGGYIRAPPNNSPVMDVTSPDMACNVANQAAPKTVKVKAGDKVTMEWKHDTRVPTDIIDASHIGPALAYIAPMESNGRGPVWVKLGDDGYSPQSKKWAVDKLRSNNGMQSVKMPNLPRGKYLLRGEIIALHEAQKGNKGAQYYPNCVQLEVTSNGNEKLPSGVSFPGAYKKNQPGIIFDVYNGFKSYPIPGPKPWKNGKYAVPLVTGDGMGGKYPSGGKGAKGSGRGGKSAGSNRGSKANPGSGAGSHSGPGLGSGDSGSGSGKGSGGSCASKCGSGKKAKTGTKPAAGYLPGGSRFFSGPLAGNGGSGSDRYGMGRSGLGRTGFHQDMPGGTGSGSGGEGSGYKQEESPVGTGTTKYSGSYNGQQGGSLVSNGTSGGTGGSGTYSGSGQQYSSGGSNGYQGGGSSGSYGDQGGDDAPYVPPTSTMITSYVASQPTPHMPESSSMPLQSDIPSYYRYQARGLLAEGEQCGGATYNGKTQCQEGLRCYRENLYWSSCKSF